MKVIAGWGFIGVAYDGVGVNVYADQNPDGSTPTLQVDWGDGQSDQMTADQDTNGDGVPDSTQFGHAYGADGTYDIVASSVGSGSQPVHLQAFEYARSTTDVSVTATSHVDHQFEGGTGNDSFTGNNSSDWAEGNDGNDTLNGGGGFDFLLGGAGDDVIKGGKGGDLLVGEDGNDRILGGNDNDFIYGGAGKDQLYGEDGDDTLDGETGKDYLYGGAGNDTFVFDAAISKQAVNRGVVQDFTQGQDHFSIRQTSDDAHYSFIGTKGFDGQGPEIRYDNTAGTTVYVDVDGNGKADYSFTMPNAIELTAQDFNVVDASSSAVAFHSAGLGAVHMMDLSAHMAMIA